LVSLTETPKFRNLPSQQGKDWYELLLEVICNLIFAFDIYVQVRSEAGHNHMHYHSWAVSVTILVLRYYLPYNAHPHASQSPAVLCGGTIVVVQARAKGLRATWHNTWTRVFGVCLLFDFVGVCW
jgi:hypothetical protein